MRSVVVTELHCADCEYATKELLRVMPEILFSHGCTKKGMQVGYVDLVPHWCPLLEGRALRGNSDGQVS